MPKAIQEDWKDFRNVIGGKTRKELSKWIKAGTIVRKRAKGGKLTVTIPEINLPRLVHGSNGGGIRRGEGEKGDIIGQDPQKGKGNKAGEGHSEGIQIQVDLDEFLDFMQEELKLPKLKPKPNQIFEETKIKYNDLSKTGPESLRHNRKTFLQALKRQAASGDTELVQPPGFATPVRIINVINDDKRYRQYQEIKIPSSNAAIFFARDCSASMDKERCDVVSDMCWWLDIWIRKFYDRVERRYFVHDTDAEEVDEQKYYGYRYGGGTKASSVFELIADEVKHKYPPEKWNIYIFYFGDGENFDSDNVEIEKIIKENLNEQMVNMIGVTQVYPYRFSDSLNDYFGNRIKDGVFKPDFLKLKDIDNGKSESTSSPFGWGFGSTPINLTEEERNKQIIDAIRFLLSDPEE